MGQLGLGQASRFIVKWMAEDHKQQPINTMCYNARKKRKSERETRGGKGRLRVGQTAPKRLRNAQTMPDFGDSIKIQTLHEHGELADV